jgi:glutamine amidotransferase
MMNKAYIQIPDYGCGNLSSIKRMVEKVDGFARIVEKASDLDPSQKIILAGVGSFDHGMRCLKSEGWYDMLNEAVLRNRAPILGICLGMQLMCNASEEGELPGLGWIDGEVKRFSLPPSSPLKIPHMGWNTVTVRRENPLLPLENQEARYYFVHSYHAVCRKSEDVLATSLHGIEITAAFSHDNIYGVQFHPEKSHRFGMKIIKNFLDVEC